MKDQTKDSGTVSARRPRVRVIQKLMAVPPAKGVIEMCCHIEGGGIVRQATSPKPVTKEEKKVPPKQKKTTTPAQVLVQDTVMKPEFEKEEKKTV